MLASIGSTLEVGGWFAKCSWEAETLLLELNNWEATLLLDDISNATPLTLAAAAVVGLLLRVVFLSFLSRRVVASGGNLELLGGFVARVPLVVEG